MNLVDYKNTVLERFSNEAMHDQLTRIASDSASKVPVYLTTTLKEVLARGSDHRIPAFTLAAWSRVLQGQDDDGKAFEVTEPRLDDRRPPATGIGRSGRGAADRAAASERCRRARGLRRQLRAATARLWPSTARKRRCRRYSTPRQADARRR